MPTPRLSSSANEAFDRLDKLDWANSGARKGDYDPIPYLNFDDHGSIAVFHVAPRA